MQYANSPEGAENCKQEQPGLFSVDPGQAWRQVPLPPSVGFLQSVAVNDASAVAVISSPDARTYSYSLRLVQRAAARLLNTNVAPQGEARLVPVTERPGKPLLHPK